MSSNCYLLWDDESHRCVIIDPASEKSLSEISFIYNHNLTLDFIILTHEHTDHNWGVNSLIEAYPDSKVICHILAKENMDIESKAYFLLYYDNPNYTYKVNRIDCLIDQSDYEIEWNTSKIRFIHVPGHSMGSMCILVNNWLFTGDAILQAKPYISKKNGSKEAFKNSVRKILEIFEEEQIIFPGHGNHFKLKEYDLVRFNHT